MLNINSSICNCSIITISWNRPIIDSRVNIHNYTLLIYDYTALVGTVSIDGNTTSYQLKGKKLQLFQRQYTYVIFGSNELGEGDYSNETFSYQRG